MEGQLWRAGYGQIVNWPAKPVSWWSLAGPAEIRIEGSTLVVRRGKAREEFDLAAADLSLSLHPWGLMRGTVLKIRQGSRVLTLAREGYLSEPPRYDRRPELQPGLLMQERDFSALIGAVQAPRGEDGDSALTFALWPDGFRFVHAFAPALAAFLFLALTCLAICVRPRPLGGALMIGLVLAMVATERRLWKRRTRPEASLSIQDEHLVLTRGAEVLGRCPLGSAKVRLVRWEPPQQGRASGPSSLDCPALVIEGLGRPAVSVGSPRAWAKTTGQKARLPRYLLSPVSWPDFVEALTSNPPLVGPSGEAQ